MRPPGKGGEAPSSRPQTPGPGAPEEAVASGEARIRAAFQQANDAGHAALMPYMMGCFPDQDSSLAIAAAYADSGAELIELGIPFSDPLADGPTIHAAATRALEAGANTERSLEICASVAERLPVVLMVYANMVLAHGGGERFAADAARAGAAGAIIPDLPLGEAEEIREAFGAAGLALVPLIAPTTSAERLAGICAVARGFVYVVSTVGTTGERDGLPAGLSELVAATRAEAEVPVAVGFGIGTPQQAAAVGRFADGVIIGSRLVRAAEEAGSPAAAARAVTAFLRETRVALCG